MSSSPPEKQHVSFFNNLVHFNCHSGFWEFTNYFLDYVLYTAASPTLTPPPNPRTTPIIPGQECVIEIPKGNTGLGLSIVGGADTLLVSRTFSTDVKLNSQK